MATQTIDLETELRYFNEHRSALLQDAPGRFALIKGEMLIGIFDSETEAIRHGYQTQSTRQRRSSRCFVASFT